MGGEVVEDVAMMSESSNIAPTAPAQTQDLTYDELRARLPEITNDVVTLIATSKQALTDFANIQTQQDVDNFNQTYNVNLVLPQEVKMEPFEKKKTEEELVGEVLVNKAIKNKLNAPRKEVKFTWEGLKNFVPFLETNPFDPLKVKRIKELTEGAEPKEKDYIEGFEEIERSLYGGVQDLGYSISSLVTEGIDAAFDTDYLQAIDKAYEENKIKDPETLVESLQK